MEQTMTVSTDKKESIQYATIESYVKEKQGKRVIKKILVANNGIAAVKGIRSLRQWCYQTFGNSKMIKFVVMATPEDIKANAEYVRLCDELVKVKGEGTENNYSNVKLIVELAKRMKCDAVWPGWGHASENPELPLQLKKNGIKFIGPESKPMRVLGDKISSSIIAESAGVPMMAWSGTGLRCKDGEMSDELFQQACVHDYESAFQSAKKVGYPLMIKASEGGGGKGIRKVLEEKDLKLNYEQVQSEVPGSPIFLMRLAKQSRHLEVQLIADEYNNAVALMSRDCSVQRRHQKILEEGPVTVASPETLREMEKAAVRLSKSVNYSCAGTVEYLYDSGHFYFLELNPRLQVEHPVTEWITGTNIPSLQLQVAMGIPLYCIPDIRQFYAQEDIYSTESIDFENSEPIEPKGHCIAARITAENPEEGFQPTSGSVQQLTFKNRPNVWGYFSIGSLGQIHSFSDSQFGHVFAFGKNRNEARKTLTHALSEIEIRGDIRTTSTYLQSLLQEHGYVSNDFTTNWLDGIIKEKSITEEKPDSFLAVSCGAAHILHSKVKANREKFLWFIERGQSSSNDLLRIKFPIELIYQDTKYVISGICSGSNKYTLSMNETHREITIEELRDGGILIVFENGESHIAYAQEDPNGLRVSVDGKICLFTKEFDPSELRSNASGKVVRFLVEDGSHINANTPFAELEMMKMIITVYAPNPGTIKFQVVEGSTINQGDIIAMVDLDDKSTIKRAVLFEGKFPPITSGDSNDDSKVTSPNRILKEATSMIESMLAGYDYPITLFENKLVNSIEQLKNVLSRNDTIIHEFIDQFSILKNAIPKALQNDVYSSLQQYYTLSSPTPTNQNGTVQAIVEDEKKYKETLDSIMNIIKTVLNKTVEKEPQKKAIIEPLFSLVRAYELGIKAHGIEVLSGLLNKFLGVEKLFDQTNKRKEEVLLQLRMRHKEEEDGSLKTYEYAFSHARLHRKVKVIRRLLECSEDLNIVKHIIPTLNELSSFILTPYSDIVLISKQILMKSRLPSLQKMRREMESMFKNALKNNDKDKQIETVRNIIDVSNYSFDILLTFFNHEDPKICELATEVYIRKAYTTFDITYQSFNRHNNDTFSTVVWKFSPRQSADFSDLNNKALINSKDAIVGSFSTGNLSSMNSGNSNNELVQESEDVVGFGVMAIFKSFEDIGAYLTSQEMLNQYQQSDSVEHSSIMKIILYSNSIKSDEEYITEFKQLFKKHKHILDNLDIKRITVLVAPVYSRGQTHSPPFYYTFRQHLDYEEDPIYRHIEPTLAFQLLLRKMCNYNISSFPVKDPSVHVYYGTLKRTRNTKKSKYDYLHTRFFVRTLVLQGDIFTPENPEDFQIAEAERYLILSLNALELAMANPKYKSSYANHIFINFLPEVVVNTTDIVTDLISKFQTVYLKRIIKLRVSEVEVKLNIRMSKDDFNVIPLRFVATNKTGYDLSVDIYQEIKDPSTGKYKYSAFYGKHKTLDGLDVNVPHQLLKESNLKRTIAHNFDTSYVYDYPLLFEKALKTIWRQHAKARNLDIRVALPRDFIKTTEMILNQETNELEESINSVNHLHGSNKFGMIVWKIKLKTPEYPFGREIIVIANDITHFSGSFGPIEDLIFQKASMISRKLGIPRFYIAANSGARIGLANEVKEKFKVAWSDPSDPTKGFRYFYLSEEDYELLKEESVNAVRVQENGEVRYKIVDIIGKEDGIGVENLRGSGMIAGETSKSYKEVFTLNYVACRTVGIGAYLVRLGQRVIQNRRHPILLTGAGALNKVLGNEVYSSNAQLGGIQIMHPNGVTHLVASDDLSAITDMLEWLSFVPDKVDSTNLPIIYPIDDVDRTIEFEPNSNNLQYDPREMLAGKYLEDETEAIVEKEPPVEKISSIDVEELKKNTPSAKVEPERKWISGFFDKDSFIETLSGWAKNVVVGRARLGGIPMGVISVETRTTEQIIPADPADSTSQERITQKAGQVWYPDSAYKTAQAIRDFSNGEQLPLMVFANWRGFSGGQRDMFDEILKFGSYIVDALVEYKKPIFIYIPPFAELRGGAWVVVDPTINPEMMEMYADPKARGGVLEPSGTVEIKYRKNDIISTIRRIDPEFKAMAKQLGTSEISKEQKREILQKMEKREKHLLPIYLNIAESICDLHDTPGRMKRKGVISEVIEWKNARKFFYWRLKRKLSELELSNRISEVDPTLPHDAKQEMMKKWIQNSLPTQDIQKLWTDDQKVLKWLEEHKNEIESHHLKIIKSNRVKSQMNVLLEQDLDTSVTSLLDFLRNKNELELTQSIRDKLSILLFQTNK